MTRASKARIARRRDRGGDDDLLVAETALAFKTAWGLSERVAIDYALALHRGKLGPASKIPRGAEAGTLVGVTLADRQSFHSRNRDIRRKLEAGKLKPDAEVVRAFIRLLCLRLREGEWQKYNKNAEG
jgi:hypothetical protein